MELESTGDQVTDISNIIDELNNINDASNLTNTLSTIAYGQLTIDLDGSFGVQVASFTHNLGYIPSFLMLVNNQQAASTYYNLPLILFAYVYDSGIQSDGAYPFFVLNGTADTKNINFLSFNVPNTPGNIIIGSISATFYILDRPIKQTT